MGQKVNPTLFRLQTRRDWPSSWIAKTKSDYSLFLSRDLIVRDFVDKELIGCGIGKVEISQNNSGMEVDLYSSKPAVLIGRKGDRIDSIQSSLKNLVGIPIKINVKEIKKPDLNPRIIAESIAEQLMKRVSFKKVLVFSASRVMDAGATGVKIQLSGRLGGAEMKRKEYVILGRVPLQTIDADIDYFYTPVRTSTGIIGVKVWIYKGNK